MDSSLENFNFHLITHPNVVPHLLEFISSSEHKIISSEEFGYTMTVAIAFHSI